MRLCCLFVALALNAGFTFAQTSVPSSAFGNNIPWMKVYTTLKLKDETIQPSDIVIYTSAAPAVEQVARKVWRIRFHKTVDYR